MDCRDFREKHIGFVDDTLPAAEMEAMHRHRRTCQRCSRHDTAVRRGLLIVRNLPTIEPSPDFMARLNARLQGMEAAGELRIDEHGAFHLTAGSFAALVAGLALLGYVTLEVTGRFAHPTELRLPPVFATAPTMPASPLASKALVAAFSTGVPVWPAVLMADQASQQLANVELYGASLR